MALIKGHLPPIAFKTITGITNDVIATQKEDTLTLESTDETLAIVGDTENKKITFTVTLDLGNST